MSVKDAQECLGAASFLIPLISDHSSRTLTLILAFSPQGRRDLSLRWNDGGGGRLLDPFGPVWPRLLLAGRLEMGPRWPRLALRSLVRGGLAGPGWPRYEWPEVAKPLIQLHLVAFRCFPVVYADIPLPRQGSHPVFLWKVLVFGHFGRYSTSGAHGFSGVIRSGGPPCPGPIWPDSLPAPLNGGGVQEWPGVANF